jgi:hypothetical protein
MQSSAAAPGLERDRVTAKADGLGEKEKNYVFEQHKRGATRRRKTKRERSIARFPVV